MIKYVPIEKGDEFYEITNEYAELLKRREWKQKRKEILKKDFHRCTKCSTYSTFFLGGIHIKGIELVGRDFRGKAIYLPKKAKEPISLHIHHTFYILERNPWEYAKNDLLTLCKRCHESEHSNVDIPVFFTENDMKIKSSPDVISCSRCGGNGYLSEYNYHKNGECFQCKGRCFLRKIFVK